MRTTFLMLLALTFMLVIAPDRPATACTIGVASGVVTSDGRPALWKVRQWGDPDGNQVVRRTSGETGYPFDFIGIRSYNYDTEIRMGVNEHGLVVGNALNGGSQNSWFMEYALGNFILVSEVQTYLEQQLNHEPPLLQAESSFEFIDATGAAFMFETEPGHTAGNRLYVYDTLDPDRLAQGMYGWVVRQNGNPHHNLDGTDDPTGGDRYEAAKFNVTGLVGWDHLMPVTVTQGNNGWLGYEFLRYGPNGYQNYEPIACDDVCSGMAVHGVRMGEDPDLTTMWAVLGQTNYAIAVPVWVACDFIPAPINTDDLADLANALHPGWDEHTVQAAVLPLEHHFFAEVAEIMEHWRNDIPHAIRMMPRVEERMTEDAYSLLERLTQLPVDQNDLAPIAKTKIIRLPDIMPVVRPFGYPGTYRLDSRAFDPDGTIDTCYWDFGDDSEDEEGLVVDHKYYTPGWYLISCTAVDDEGVKSTDWTYLYILDPKSDTSSTATPDDGVSIE
jgi:hypothetical protein